MAKARVKKKSTSPLAKRRSSSKSRSKTTSTSKLGSRADRATAGKVKPSSKPKSKRTLKAKAKSKSVAVKAETPREGKPHSYWPRSSERQLIVGLSEDLRDAYDRFKSTMTGFGAQYIYASAKAIMFARQRCYAFVRPKKKYLEITFFRDERIADERLKRVDAVSARKFAHIIHVTHADQIEEPLTDWLSGAYSEAPAGIPPNFRGEGGGDDVEIIAEGEGPRGFAGTGSDVDLDDIDPWDLER